MNKTILNLLLGLTGLLLCIGLVSFCFEDHVVPSSFKSLKNVVTNSGAADGIPILFNLQKPGYVTLVIDDGQGRRIRNLVSNKYFTSGRHEIYWDGYDEGTPSNYERRNVGMTYQITRHKVSDGVYHISGLTHDKILLRYELSVQSPGRPPWHTVDGSGAWLADHSPPSDVLFLPDGSPFGKKPQLMVSAPVAEAGHSLMWLDESGRKIFGRKIGWEGGNALARDLGKEKDQNISAYCLSIRKGKRLSLFAIKNSGEQEIVFQTQLEKVYDRRSGTSLAVFNGRAAISLPIENTILLIDVSSGRIISRIAIEQPRGLLASSSGGLLVVKNKEVWNYTIDWQAGRVLAKTVLISKHLEAPQQLTRDNEGRIYVSDWGGSHQVKVFDVDGHFVREIGHPGGPVTGRYDPLRMRYPNGVAVDELGQLWVAEISYVPKRISVWHVAGAYIRAFYGPPKYGGGGAIDPRDSTVVYYATGGSRRGVGRTSEKAGIAFKLDYSSGKSVPSSIYMQTSKEDLVTDLPSMGPEQPVYIGNRRYLVNTFNQSAQGMKSVVGIWRWNDDETVTLVSVVGYHGNSKNHSWLALNRPEIRSHWPKGSTARKLFFAWSDLNNDGRISPNEIQYKTVKRGQGLVSVGRGLEVNTSWLTTIDPPSVRPDGVPVFDLDSWRASGDVNRADADILQTDDGWLIHAGGPVSGFRHGERKWIYHSQWYRRAPAPAPGKPGQLIETSRIIGFDAHPTKGQAGRIWALASDKGMIYLFTTDGLFLQAVGGDLRKEPLLRSKGIHRGDLMEDFSFDEEDFWPTLSQVETNGAIYLLSGKEHSSVFRLEGFSSVRRIDAGTIHVDRSVLSKLPEPKPDRSRSQIRRRLSIVQAAIAPTADGDLSEWGDAQWNDIDETLGMSAALMVSNDHLWVAFRTRNSFVLQNNGADGWQYLFASGGGLDIQLAPRLGRNSPRRQRKGSREQATNGGIRLFVTRLRDPVDGPVKAILFKKITDHPRGGEFTYSSPIGQESFADVSDVSGDVTLGQHDGNYEVGIPLSLLGLPTSGIRQLMGDIGIFLGNGSDTTRRLYWSNKTETMVSDIPTESRLYPEYWGMWRFMRKR